MIDIDGKSISKQTRIICFLDRSEFSGRFLQRGITRNRFACRFIANNLLARNLKKETGENFRFNFNPIPPCALSLYSVS